MFKRYKEALVIIEESLALCRSLTEIDQRTYRPELAKTLNSYGNVLLSLRRYDEALSATEEALALYADLPQTDLEVHKVELARALYCHGVILSELSRNEAALVAMEEAVGLFRNFYKISGSKSDLVQSLNQYERILLKLGWDEAASAVKQERISFLAACLTSE